MTHITTHQLTQIARAAHNDSQGDPDMRARFFFARLLGLLTDAESDRVAIAMGFDHLTNANGSQLIQQQAA